MPEQSRIGQIQYKIRLALFSQGLIEEKHLKYGYLCNYNDGDSDEDAFYKLQEIDLNSNTNTVSLQYDEIEIIGGISIWTMNYYLENEPRFWVNEPKIIPFVFDNKQYVLTIERE